MNDELKHKNLKLARRLLLIAGLMFGFGYALVPLYDVLCNLTGQNIKLKASGNNAAVFASDENREVKVEFVTSVNESTPIVFSAETNTIKVHPGKYYTVNFFAENKTDKPLKAQAIPSISPGVVEQFFNKIECFCFTTQEFLAKEKKIMPVRFVINPKLPVQYQTITLSYTFFDKTNIKEN